MEIKVLEAIQKIQTPLLTSILKVITHLGDHGLFWLVLGGVLFFLHKRKEALSVFLSLGTMQIVNNVLIKNLVKRARPFELYSFILLITEPTGFSFPSGHTASAFACATAIFIENKKWGVIAYIFATIMGFSRLYFAVHFPSDVLAGVVVGVLCGIIGSKISQKILYIYENKYKDKV